MADMGTQLAELATQMKTTIHDHFVPTLEGMKHKFDDEMHQMTSWADDIHEAIEEIRDTLPDQVRKMIENLHHRQDETKTEVEACLAQGQEYQDEVHQAEDSVHTLSETINNHGHDLQTGFESAQELGNTVQEEISHNLTEWMSAIDHTLGQADEHSNHIEQNFLHLGSEMAHGIADVVGQIGHATSFVTDHVAKSLDNFGSELDHMHGDQHEHLVGQIGEAIGGNVGGVISSVGEFIQAGEEMGDLFNGHIGDVLGSVEQVGNVINEIKPIIDLADALL